MEINMEKIILVYRDKDECYKFASTTTTILGERFDFGDNVNIEYGHHYLESQKQDFIDDIGLFGEQYEDLYFIELTIQQCIDFEIHHY